MSPLFWKTPARAPIAFQSSANQMDITLLVSGSCRLLQYLKGTLNVLKGVLHNVYLGTNYLSDIIDDFHADNKK